MSVEETKQDIYAICATLEQEVIAPVRNAARATETERNNLHRVLEGSSRSSATETIPGVSQILDELDSGAERLQGIVDALRAYAESM